MSAASARIQIDILGRGTFGSLHVGQCYLTSEITLSALDGSGETLVPLGVVVLQTDLQLDSLDEVTTFFSRGSQEFLDGAPHARHRELATTVIR